MANEIVKRGSTEVVLSECDQKENYQLQRARFKKYGISEGLIGPYAIVQRKDGQMVLKKTDEGFGCNDNASANGSISTYSGHMFGEGSRPKGKYRDEDKLYLLQPCNLEIGEVEPIGRPV